uniref:Chemosensory protein 23 n=1 Tax=Dendrolimus punctatus TaxID=238572 RepID=A0A2K8GL11_9NEOP|nr:Chemosensory protein 23 [Dendrolimus punctatus]
MKSFIILGCVLAVAVALYTDEFDNLDVMEMVKNPRTLKGYTDCLTEKGPCPPPGKALKENIKEAMLTDCAQCTEKQKEKATESIRYLFRNERKIFDQVADVYDPSGQYRKDHGMA